MRSDESFELLKKLHSVFKKSLKPNLRINNSTDMDCEECVERHEEIVNGRGLMLDDLAKSCYSYMFFEADSLEYFMAFYFQKLFSKEENEYETFAMTFLESLREKDKFPVNYSQKKVIVIIEALEFSYSLYFMEEYEIWDFEFEQMVVYDYNQSIVEELEKSLVFWKSKRVDISRD